jgi:hypothetical protein
MGARVGRPWPRWLAVGVGSLAVPVAAALVAAPGLVAAWFVLAGFRPADIARVTFAWVAGSGVVGFASGGWLAARVAGAEGREAFRLGVATGAAALGLLAALVLVGFGEAVALRPAGIALGIVDPAATVPAPVPDWVETGAATVGPPERARAHTIAAIAYLVVAALLSLWAAGLGGLTSGGGAADSPVGSDDA